MRRIALINQKGGVGKTTTAANLGAALARSGRRVVLIDLDPQANLTVHLGADVKPDEPTVYDILSGRAGFGDALRTTGTPGLFLVPSHLDLSGAEMELAAQFGRETLLKSAFEDWLASGGEEALDGELDYLLIDCPPSLGLLSINGLTTTTEVFLAVQTEFFALQGMSKLVEVIELVKRRLHPELELTGIVPCLYDNRLRLAREVLGELRNYFPTQVFKTAIGMNVKLAEAPGFGQSIFEYAPKSVGARDYTDLADEVIAQEALATVELQPAPAPEPTAPSADRVSDAAS